MANIDDLYLQPCQSIKQHCLIVIEPHFFLAQLALVPEIGAAGVLVATDSALLAGYKNLASLERTTSLNMEHMQVDIISCHIASNASYEKSGK